MRLFEHAQVEVLAARKARRDRVRVLEVTSQYRERVTQQALVERQRTTERREAAEDARHRAHKLPPGFCPEYYAGEEKIERDRARAGHVPTLTLLNGLFNPKSVYDMFMDAVLTTKEDRAILHLTR